MRLQLVDPGKNLFDALFIHRLIEGNPLSIFIEVFNLPFQLAHVLLGLTNLDMQWPVTGREFLECFLANTNLVDHGKHLARLPVAFVETILVLIGQVGQIRGANGFDARFDRLAAIVVIDEQVIFEALLQLGIARRRRGLGYQVRLVRQVVDQARKNAGDSQAGELQHDKRRRALVNL